MKKRFILERASGGTRIVYANKNASGKWQFNEGLIPYGKVEIINKVTYEPELDNLICFDVRDDKILVVVQEAYGSSGLPNFSVLKQTEKDQTLHNCLADSNEIKRVSGAFFATFHPTKSKFSESANEFDPCKSFVVAAEDNSNSVYILRNYKFGIDLLMKKLIKFDMTSLKIKREVNVSAQKFAVYDDSLVVCADNNHLYFVDLSKSSDVQNKKTYKAHSSIITDICFSANGEYFFTSSFDGTVATWDLRNPETKISEDYLSRGPIVSVRPNPIDCHSHISAATDGSVCVRIVGFNPYVVKNFSKPPSLISPAAFADISPVDPSIFVASCLMEDTPFVSTMPDKCINC